MIELQSYTQDGVMWKPPHYSVDSGEVFREFPCPLNRDEIPHDE